MKSKTQQTRKRVQMYRGIQSIIKRDSCEINLVNPIQLKKKILNNSSQSDEPPKLSNELRSWAIQFHIKRRALTALLKILKSFGMQSLPSDSRCLLKTPRIIEIEDRAGGKYWNNGIKKTLSQVFNKLSSNLLVEINVNIDGLPLFKSSPETFWPILANVHGRCNVEVPEMYSCIL